jgi:iron complex transport system substrate-binding protein
MAQYKEFTDDLGRSVRCVFPPQRIVSLCPSITETVIDLAGANRVVGRTEFCIHPASVADQIATIGGTKNINIATVKSLQPDLIIAEKEENTRPKIEKLAGDFPVFVFNVVDVASALNMIEKLGQLLAAATTAEAIGSAIREGMQALEPPKVRPRVAYFIWRDPWMVAGRETYIDSMLNLAGLDNAFKDAKERYPRLNEDAIRAIAPDVVFLSSEPYDFGESHIVEMQNLLPKASVRLVDGEMFSWYGSRMKAAMKYLKGLSF